MGVLITQAIDFRFGFSSKIFFFLTATFLLSILLPESAMAACSNTGVVARVSCTLSTTIDSVTRGLFDAISFYLQPIILGLLTIFLIVFAVSFLSGIINLSAREFGITFFKFALVWNFAAFWDQGAGFAYEFFRTFALSGSDMVWTALAPPPPPSGSTPTAMQGLTGIDASIANAIGFSADSTSGVAAAGMPGTCRKTLIGALVLLLIINPAIFGFIFIYIWNLIKFSATAVLYYFKSLILISFLIVLSPIFVSFALFKSTQTLFNTWIKHLGLNALQMLILLAFFAMILLVDFQSFFADFFKLFRIWSPLGAGTENVNLGFGAINVQAGLCSICEHTVTNSYQNIACNPNDQAISPFAIVFQFDFWMWLITKVIAFQILTYILSDFLQRAPDIAQQLAGVRYGGILGGSASAPGFAGYTNFGFAAIGSGAAAFKEAQRNAYYRPGIIGAIPVLSALRNPLKVVTHPKNFGKSVLAAAGVSQKRLNIQNKHLQRYEMEYEDYSKRSQAAKRAMQKSKDVLDHNTRMVNEGKLPRAAMISAQNAYNLSLVNSNRWNQKLSESKQKLDLEEKRHKQSEGAWGSLISPFVGGKEGDIIDREYSKLVANPRAIQDGSKLTYFLPTDKKRESDEQRELDRLRLEEMLSYGEKKSQELSEKLYKSSDRMSQHEKERIERQLSSANDALRSGDADRVSQSLDTLSSVSRDLE